MNNLYHHFRTRHNLIIGGMFARVITCGQEGCLRTFHHTWSFKRHLKSQHRELEALHEDAAEEAGDVLEPAENIGGDDDDNDNDNGNDPEADEWDGFVVQEVQRRALGLVCAMKASTSVVQSTVNIVVNQV